LIIFGSAELLFALALVIFWQRRWPVFLCLVLMCLGTAGVAMKSPKYIAAAFNPLTLNLAVGCLALVDLLILKRTRPIDPAIHAECG
jgi:ABC-type iron transport system FetAB permease component